MSVQADEVTYRRSPSALWRDTGRHVLVAPVSGTDVVVLGGGGAASWRHLEQPADAAALRARFAEAGEAPDAGQLAEHLGALCELGVLVAERSCDPRRR